MASQDSAELEQLRRTAEMFEMILQATPEAVENYENLKEIYRKLHLPVKVKDTYLRLIDHHTRAGNSSLARTELDTAFKEFPGDPVLQARSAELGATSPERDYEKALEEHEDLCIHCEDARVRLSLARHEVEKARSKLAEEEAGTAAPAECAEDMLRNAVESRIELLQTMYVRRAIRNGSRVYSELKKSYEERMRVCVAEHPQNLQRGFRDSRGILEQLDRDYAEKLRKTEFEIEEPSEEEIAQIRREEEAALGSGAATRSTARKDLEEKEAEYRAVAQELEVWERDKSAAEESLKTLVEKLPDTVRSRAAAELLAMIGALEIVPIDDWAAPGLDAGPDSGANHVDEIAKQLEEAVETEQGTAQVGEAPAWGGKAAGLTLTPETVQEDRGTAVHTPPGDGKFADADDRSRELGDLLVKRGVITQKNLEDALKVQRDSGKRLGLVIIELGFSTDEEILDCLSTETGMPYLPLSSYEMNAKAAHLLPAQIARKYGIVPVDVISNSLLVTMAGPLDAPKKAEIEHHLKNFKISYYISSPTEVYDKLRELYPS
jgi:hypothetical protein